MFETREVEPGLMSGRSLFNGATVFARLVCDESLMRVEYRVGPTPERLLPWIQSWVRSGAELGYRAEQCLVGLSAIRPQTMSDASWEQVMRTHETEIDLIVAQLEAGESRGRG